MRHMFSRALGLATTCLSIFIAYGTSYAQTDTAGSQWKLVWSDEFEGDALDMSKWSYEQNCWGGGNSERQCYTDSEANVSVSDGVLKLTARKERMTGAAWPPHMISPERPADATKTQPFTSGRIRTINKGDWRYGRFDIRAKLPNGQGTWPAIWMLPTEDVYGSWAASGEIDIIEAVNLGASCKSCPNRRENRIHATLHHGGAWPGNKQSGTDTELPGAIDDWYEFSLVWSAGVMTWYVNGERYARQTYEDWGTDSKAAEGRLLAPFDQKFHLIMNFALGGEWPESANSQGIKRRGFPKTFEIDYVRVYQCASDPEMGLDCISR